MADRAKLESALRNAHAAGDVEAAKKLANALKNMDAAPAAETKPNSAKEQGAARGKQLSEGILGPVTAFGAGVGGGAFEAVNSLVRNAKEREGASPEEAKQYADAVLGTLAKENPASFGLGYGAGAVSSGGALVKGAQVLGKGIPAVAGLVEAAAPVVGQPVRNVLKLAAGGGTGAGVAEANRGGSAEDVKKAATTGALLAPPLAAAARGAGSFINFARSAIDKNSEEGFRVLAKIMRRKGSPISAEVMKQRAADFRAATGKAPAITDLVGNEGAEDVLNVTFRGSGASRKLAQAAADRATGLQTELADAVVAGRKTPAVTKLQQYKKIAADRAMQKIENKTVHFDTDAIKALTESKEVRRALPETERDLLFALEDSGGELSIRQVDNIRQALRKKSKGAGGPASRIREFANALVDDAADQVPEFGQFLKSYARRSRAIEGAEFGRGVLRDSPTEFSAQAESLTKPGLGGARVGARATLSDAARKSPKAAAETARSLSEDSGLAQKLESLDPEEAARLRRLGDIEKESLRGVAKLGAGAQRNLSEKDAATTRAAIDALLSGTGVGSLSFKVSAFRRFFNANRVPPKAAEKLANDLIDPAKTDATLRRLAALGISPRKVEEFARQTARTGARASSGQNSGEE